MQTERTNQEWIICLSGPHQPQDAAQDAAQEAALVALRELLLRAALYTLVTHLQDLRDLDERERVALAEDCAQEALQAVLEHLADFRGESKFTTWAYKFGVNIALTRARKERWKAVSLDELSDDEDALDWVQWKETSHAADSEKPSLQAEIGEVIKAAIRSELTGRQRQVLKWIAFDGVPMDVVVERLDTNRNAVYKMLHDARLKIKRQLAARGYEVDEVYEIFRMV